MHKLFNIKVEDDGQEAITIEIINTKIWPSAIQNSQILKPI